MAGEGPYPLRAEIECGFYCRDQLLERLVFPGPPRERTAFLQARTFGELRPTHTAETRRSW